VTRIAPPLVALAVLAAACGGGSDEATQRRPPRTTATAPTITTTTRPADLNAVHVALTKVSDVTSGTAFAVRKGDPTLYVARQAGQVVAIRDGQVDPAPVLDLAGRIQSGGEQGLLGIVFSPDGSKLYVHFTGTDGDSRLEELAFTPTPGGGGSADPATARLLLTAPGAQPNHNGGQLAFGPDGMLYMGLGDGGGAGDEGAGHAPQGNGQSLDTLLGKILRIDPHPSADRAYTIPLDNPYAKGGGLPEIWVLGLRNPWRFSFDPTTRDLWIGDVGQNLYEEVDMVPFATAGGSNFGWPDLEATHDYRGGAPAGTVQPVFETSHADGNCAITGGFVYRGKQIPDLNGAYVFSDNCNGTIRAIKVVDGQVTVDRDLGVRSTNVSSLGVDANGELYVVSLSDGVFRIDPAA
jgi:glucose/arabinose dehydrogenase